MNLNIRSLRLESGPATLIPLVHVPLLKDAPRVAGGYKVMPDGMGEDLCHFYGDFSGYHLYLIATTYKKNLIASSLDYHDKSRGMFSVALSVMGDNGLTKTIQLDNCQAPLCEPNEYGLVFPERITVEQFSPGTPDGIKFHFAKTTAKFKFGNNLIPFIPESERLGHSRLFDLDVEYIGRAVGQDGTREVADRLGNGHSTESKILAELNHKRTNRDAYAILYKPGRLKSDGGEDVSLSYTHLVDTFEKALISFFLPIKNILGRNFPNDCSDSAIRLAKLDVTELQIEVESPLEYGLLSTDDVLRERVHRFNMRIPELR